MINKIDENTLIWSDENQINLVIRNLMSNALKFTPKNGTITIKAKEMMSRVLYVVKGVIT